MYLFSLPLLVQTSPCLTECLIYYVYPLLYSVVLTRQTYFLFYFVKSNLSFCHCKHISGYKGSINQLYSVLHSSLLGTPLQSNAIQYECPAKKVISNVKYLLACCQRGVDLTLWLYLSGGGLDCIIPKGVFKCPNQCS